MDIVPKAWVGAIWSIAAAIGDSAICSSPSNIGPTCPDCPLPNNTICPTIPECLPPSVTTPAFQTPVNLESFLQSECKSSDCPALDSGPALDFCLTVHDYWDRFWPWLLTAFVAVPVLWILYRFLYRSWPFRGLVIDDIRQKARDMEDRLNRGFTVADNLRREADGLLRRLRLTERHLMDGYAERAKLADDLEKCRKHGKTLQAQIDDDQATIAKLADDLEKCRKHGERLKAIKETGDASTSPPQDADAPAHGTDSSPTGESTLEQDETSKDCLESLKKCREERSALQTRLDAADRIVEQSVRDLAGYTQNFGDSLANINAIAGELNRAQSLLRIKEEASIESAPESDAAAGVHTGEMPTDASTSNPEDATKAASDKLERCRQDCDSLERRLRDAGVKAAEDAGKLTEALAENARLRNNVQMLVQAQEAAQKAAEKDKKDKMPSNKSEACDEACRVAKEAEDKAKRAYEWLSETSERDVNRVQEKLAHYQGLVAECESCTKRGREAIRVFSQSVNLEILPDELKERLVTANAKIEDLQETIRDMTENQVQGNSNSPQRNTAAVDLNEIVEEASRAADESKTQYEALKKELEDARAALAEKGSAGPNNSGERTSTCEQDCLEAKGRQEAAERELQELKERTDKERDDAKENMETTQRMRDTALADVSALEKVVSTARDKNSVDDRTIKGLRKANENLKAANATLRDNKANASPVMNADDPCADVRNELEKAKEEVEELETKIEGLETKIEELETKIKDMVTDHKRSQDHLIEERDKAEKEATDAEESLKRCQNAKALLEAGLEPRGGSNDDPDESSSDDSQDSSEPDVSSNDKERLRQARRSLKAYKKAYAELLEISITAAKDKFTSDLQLRPLEHRPGSDTAPPLPSPAPGRMPQEQASEWKSERHDLIEKLQNRLNGLPDRRDTPGSHPEPKSDDRMDNFASELQSRPLGHRPGSDTQPPLPPPAPGHMPEEQASEWGSERHNLMENLQVRLSEGLGLFPPPNRRNASTEVHREEEAAPPLAAEEPRPRDTGDRTVEVVDQTASESAARPEERSVCPPSAESSQPADENSQTSGRTQLASRAHPPSTSTEDEVKVPSARMAGPRDPSLEHTSRIPVYSTSLHQGQQSSQSEKEGPRAASTTENRSTTSSFSTLLEKARSLHTASGQAGASTTPPVKPASSVPGTNPASGRLRVQRDRLVPELDQPKRLERAPSPVGENERGRGWEGKRNGTEGGGRANGRGGAGSQGK